MVNDAKPLSGIVVLGVSGVGKTTVGRLLAEALNWNFVEADDFHSDVSRQKMASGIGLTDVDREPWLEAVNIVLNQQAGGWVLACSALKQRYREMLVAQRTDVAWVWLHGNTDLLRLRLRLRENHYAGESLLNTQLADLQPPDDCLQLDVVEPPQALARKILSQLSPGLSVRQPVLVSDKNH